MKNKKEDKKAKQESASFFSELGEFMAPYKTKYSLSIFLSVLSVASNIAAYAFAGVIAGMLFSENRDFKTVLLLAIGASLCKILHAVLLNVSTLVSHKAAYLTLKDIRHAIFSKMLSIPMGYFETNGTGRLKTMAVDNIESMEKTLAHMLPELTANLLAPLFCMVWMFFIDWRLSLIMLIWIFLGFSVTFGMMKNYEEKYSGQIRALKSMNQAVIEYVGGIKVIKNFGRADECYKKYSDAVYNHANYNINWQKQSLVYSALGMAIAPFSLFPILIFGALFFSQGSIEAGKFCLMIILSFGIFVPLMNAMNYFDQLAGMGTSAKEIKSVLSYREVKRGAGAVNENSDVEFKNVSFRYDENSKNAVDSISFKIESSKMIAFVGPSGSGKSTAAKLLAGFWDADSGEILIGNKKISDYTQEQLNSLIAFVDQDNFLFDESIEDNIRMGKPSASYEEVVESAKRAGCDEFIRKLPDGYRTLAGSAGNRLSGGERQRITIARAIIKDAPIMILDEATASTDPENEAYIQQAMTQAAKDKTLIVIAHRLHTVMNADKIAFFKDGKILNIGSHEYMLKNCSEYAQMWKKAEEK